ncbi:SRPBCC family protein [Jannaschia seohaensis]|uniref:SRPBCC family protein n=1 Tax=Jannaschia seohaensis TaxID=475081 RepID=UPI000D6C27EE|nr:SRPBCC family protein [Jannaschia seohaensis]
MKFRNQIDIKVPPEVAFVFVADQRNNPKWNYYVTRVTQERGDAPGLGARYRIHRKTDKQTFAITFFKSGDSFTVETVEGRPIFHRNIEFQTVPIGTRLIDTWELRTGFPYFLEIFAVGRVRRAVGENLKMLKELLEVGSVRLQDGRLSSILASDGMSGHQNSI